MYYTEKDADNAIKVLFFEGAGCVERGTVENCRIRTAFTNNEGKGIYLELWGIEVTKNSPERYKVYEYAGVVDYCYEVLESGEQFRFDIEEKTFNYSKRGILDFVNENLNCSFTEIKVLDTFDGYRVHKDGGGYNFIEDFEYKPEIAAARRKAYNEIDMQIREQLCEKYSKINLESMNDESITVRVYASDKSMQAHGMNPNERHITVKI